MERRFYYDKRNLNHPKDSISDIRHGANPTGINSNLRNLENFNKRNSLPSQVI